MRQGKPIPAGRPALGPVACRRETARPGGGTLRPGVRLPHRDAPPSSAVPSDIAIAVSQPRRSALARVAVAVATAGGVGFAPWAPGTWGAALAVPVFVLSSPSGAVGLAALGLGLLVLGVWAAEEAERVFGRKDDGRIVIDEVVGQLAALAPLLAFADAGGAGEPAGRAPALGLVTGFVAFRVFDVWKPGPVRWAERTFRGGIGVMMDDVVAGLLGAAVVAGLGVLGAFAS